MASNLVAMASTLGAILIDNIYQTSCWVVFWVRQALAMVSEELRKDPAIVQEAGWRGEFAQSLCLRLFIFWMLSTLYYLQECY